MNLCLESFVYSELNFVDRFEIYTGVLSSFDEYPLTYEQFDRKHLGAVGSSKGILCRSAEGTIVGWRAYVPYYFDATKKVTHYAGCDAYVLREHRKQNLLYEMTLRQEREFRDEQAIIYGYPNRFNKSYERMGYNLLGCFHPIPIRSQPSPHLIDISEQTDQFKSGFLPSVVANSGKRLFHHPTRPWLYINHRPTVSFSDLFVGIRPVPTIGYRFNPASRGELNLFAKSFNAPLKDAMRSLALSDFL